MSGCFGPTRSLGSPSRKSAPSALGGVLRVAGFERAGAGAGPAGRPVCPASCATSRVGPQRRDSWALGRAVCPPSEGICLRTCETRDGAAWLCGPSQLHQPRAWAPAPTLGDHGRTFWSWGLLASRVRERQGGEADHRMTSCDMCFLRITSANLAVTLYNSTTDWTLTSPLKFPCGSPHPRCDGI